MPETIKIVDNDRVWYDPEIQNNAPVVYQNINYATGNSKSVAKTRHRYIQDLNKRLIPNSVRHGVSLSENSPNDGDIEISAGYAVVGGRFLEIETLTFDTNAESLTGDTDYYLVIKVTPIAEGGTRDPSGESADIRAIEADGYTTSHNELVIAKFTYTGSAVSNFVDYVAEQEWQANVISPVAAHPDSSNGSTQILLRAGQVERIDNLGIETTTTRVYKTVTLEDQDGSPIGTTQIINKDQITRFRDGSDSSFTSVDMLNLRTGGVQRISSAGNMTNIGTVNTHTIPGGTDTFVMLNSTQTLTNKTLTSAQINSPFLRSVQIDDTSNDHQYIVGVSELTADRTITLPLLIDNDTFVFENFEQTLMEKTLTDLKIRDSDDSNTITFTTPNLSADRIIEVPALSSTADENELVTKGATQTLTNKTLTTPTISDFTNATHTHADTANGGTVAISDTTGTLAVSRGGTGITSATQYGVVVADTTSAYTTIADTGGSKLLVSQSSANPSWQTPTITLTSDVTGSASMNSSGDWSITTTVTDNSHLHDFSRTVIYPPATHLAGGLGTSNPSIDSNRWSVTGTVSDSGDIIQFLIPTIFLHQRLTDVDVVVKNNEASSERVKVAYGTIIEGTYTQVTSQWINVGAGEDHEFSLFTEIDFFESDEALCIRISNDSGSGSVTIKHIDVGYNSYI